MRYLVLQPKTPEFDPRFLDIKDMVHLHEVLDPIVETGSEVEAKYAVRRAFPSALGMPFPLKVGSGHTVLLGFVADPSLRIDVDDDIPFVMFVQPLSQSDVDRRTLAGAIAGKGNVFDKDLWRLKPLKPQLAQSTPVEWRTSELDVPAFLEAQIGYDESGKLIVYLEMGDHSLSIRFKDPYISIRRDGQPPKSDQPATHH